MVALKLTGADAFDDVSIGSLGFAQLCSWGTLYYSFPQLADAMMAEFSWVKSEVYGALTLSFLFSALAAIPVGQAIDKGLGRQVMTGASVFAGLLFLLGSQLSALWSFYVVFAGIGLLQAGTLYEAVFSVIANHFDVATSRRHITTLTLWGGFAATLFIPLIEWLLLVGNWRQVMITLAGINILVGLLIYRRLPISVQPRARTEAERAEHKVGASVEKNTISESKKIHTRER
ncbi:MFS transporter [Pseudoteredinibacter isoporae]|uniref:MFS transporter n=1 Tax=Pseudoteredinibacter isoporae TaxID=570281 RepID=UPI003109350B